MGRRKKTGSSGSLTALTGRSRWEASDARTVLAAWRGSGGSLAAFSRRHGLSYYRIQSWRKRLAEPPAAPTFHPIRVVERTTAPTAGSESDAIAVVVRGGRRVVVGAGFDPSVLVALVEVLEGC
jgi:transposase